VLSAVIKKDTGVQYAELVHVMSVVPPKHWNLDLTTKGGKPGKIILGVSNSSSIVNTRIVR
jgi:pyruvoyl-dependent arginine decarboxylase (PvlArgDC)